MVVAIAAKPLTCGGLPWAQELQSTVVVHGEERDPASTEFEILSFQPGESWPPSGDIHILVTTRRRDLTRHPHISLLRLTGEEGLALLNSGSRRFAEEAKRLVEDVGGLPLALEVLRAYLDRCTDLSIAAVRTALAGVGEMALLKEFASEYCDELPTRHERDVAATFQLSWNLASEDGKNVLRVMAQLAPSPVPLRLLRACLKWKESTGDRLSKAIADL